MFNEIRKALLKWYKTNGRKFSWREHNDPYTMIIVEVLLKKTTAPVVDRFIKVFFEHYPNIQTLNEGSLIEIQRLLAPLGLSKQRAEQLKELSAVLVEKYNGEIPRKKEELLKLPGVGEYTAGAILSFAYGAQEAIVDTNIARLIVRLFDIKPSHYEARRSPEVWEKAREIVGLKGKQGKLVNWALLDLAAAICKAKSPLHEECPLKGWCLYVKHLSNA